MRARAVLALAAAFLGVAGGSEATRAAEPLPSFTVDLAQTSVSGLSSGAYMAGQFHLAFSSTLIGAGIVAGGPYDCAEGQLSVALNRCMQTHLGAPDPAHLLEVAETFAARGWIDPLSGLADDRVYLFSGTRDATVTPAVVEQAAAFYRLAGVPEGAISYVRELPAGHAFITEDEGNACGVTESPFINDCDYDQAGAILRHLYADLEPPASAPDGRMLEFDQGEFLPDPTTHGFGATGFAYVPAACSEGETCRVHIAFHGCRQTVDRIGDAFIADAGYNRWAETNRIIVLYPQAHETPQNPNACWDWWGYDDPSYPTKAGRQMAAVRAMLDRLAGASGPGPEFCEAHTASNFWHWQAGRAHVCSFWFLCAAGSNENLGLPFGISTVYERPEGFFSLSACQS